MGWVTTTFSEAKTLPPPTGISLVLARAVPPPELVTPGLAEPPDEPLLPLPLPLPPLLPLPQAATTTATPATPRPARAPRRVVSGAGQMSSVTE